LAPPYRPHHETAVWNEPASFDNIQEKFNAVQGLADNVAFYARNREGPYTSASGTYHTTGRHSPRIDATKGFLFGLQGWNRVSYWVPGDVGHAATVFAPARPEPWDRNAPLAALHVDDSTDVTIPRGCPAMTRPAARTLLAGARSPSSRKHQNPGQANAVQKKSCRARPRPPLGSDASDQAADSGCPSRPRLWTSGRKKRHGTFAGLEAPISIRKLQAERGMPTADSGLKRGQPLHHLYAWGSSHADGGGGDYATSTSASA
jgi:hypothetical protein